MLIVGEKIIQGYICCSSALLNGLSLRQYQVLAGVTVYLAQHPHHPSSLSPGDKIIRDILLPTLSSLPLTQENLANSIQNNIYFL